MKNAIYNNDYISNKKKVFDILKQKDFDLLYKGIKNNMYCYTLIIDKVKFDYFEGLGLDHLTINNKYDKILNALWCILQDSDTLTFFKSITDFMQEYGYLDYTKALQVYNTCKTTKKKLDKLFTCQEINILNDNINY